MIARVILATKCWESGSAEQTMLLSDLRIPTVSSDTVQAQISGYLGALNSNFHSDRAPPVGREDIGVDPSQSHLLSS